MKKLSFIIFFLLTVSVVKSQQIKFVVKDTAQVFSSLSEALKNPQEVYRLNLSKSKLDTFPQEIFQLVNLRELNLSRNNIEEIPADIGSLTKLEVLNISSNKLVHLPAQIGNLTSLVYLNLNRNVLEDLPPEIGNLKSLEYLELWDNELRTIPDEISFLQNLKFLELRGILFSDEEQSRIDGLVVKSAKLMFSPSCACKY